jgi:hypothetical protein
MGKGEPSLSNPIGLANLAKDYFDLAAIGERSTEYRPHFSMALAFNVQHGWELVLKAFLRASGVPENALYGHELTRLLQAAKGRGLETLFCFSADEAAKFEDLGKAVARHENRYLNLNHPSGTPDLLPLIGAGLRFYCSILGETPSKADGRVWY